jgi:hypothetical protein
VFDNKLGRRFFGEYAEQYTHDGDSCGIHSSGVLVAKFVPAATLMHLSEAEVLHWNDSNIFVAVGAGFDRVDKVEPWVPPEGY